MLLCAPDVDPDADLDRTVSGPRTPVLRRMEHTTQLTGTSTRKHRAASASTSTSAGDLEMVLDARTRVELARQRSKVSFEQRTIPLDKQFRTAPGGSHIVTLDSPPTSPRVSLSAIRLASARRSLGLDVPSSLVARAAAGLDDSTSSKDDEDDEENQPSRTNVETKKKRRKCVSFLEVVEGPSRTSASSSTSDRVLERATLVRGDRTTTSSIASRPRCTADPESENAHWMSPIHAACRKGDYLVVKHVLSFYVGRDGVHLVNSACACGLTPLQVACAQGHVKIAQLLLQQHAKVNRRPKKSTQLNDATNRRTRSCLALACSARNLELVELLLECGAKLDEDALVTACAFGDIAIVRTLLAAPQRVHAVDLLALRTPKLISVPEIETDSDIDVETEDMPAATISEPKTPSIEIDPMWMFAAATTSLQHEHPALVQVLLGNGSTPRSRSLVPILALEASSRGDAKLLRCLSKMYAPDLVVGARDVNGNSVLHLAVKRNSTKCVMLALRRDVDVNARDKNGISALYLACARGASTIVHLLVRAGATCERMGPNNETPLHIAAQENHLLCVETLLKDGNAHVDTLTADRRTALHLACQCGHTEVAQCLLDHGADVNARTTNNETPLLLATRMSNLETVKLLINRHADTSVIGGGDRDLLRSTSASTASSSMSTNTLQSMPARKPSLLKEEDESMSDAMLDSAHSRRSSEEVDDHVFIAQSSKHTSFKHWLRNVMHKK